MLSVENLFALFGVTAVYLGLLITAFYRLSKARAEGDKELHDRIDRVRETYVRREDLDGHITRIEKAIDTIREEQRETARETRENAKETTRRLDLILSHLTALKTLNAPSKTSSKDTH